MGEDARCNQTPQQIRRVCCDKKQPPQKKDKQKNHNHRAENPKLFTDNREDHVILCFGQGAKLLRAVSESFSEKAARSDRIQSLHHLISSGLLILLRMKPGGNSLNSERSGFCHLIDHSGQTHDLNDDEACRQNDHRQADQLPRVRMCDHNQDIGNPDNNDRR